jgi:hypothetical protein
MDSYCVMVAPSAGGGTDTALAAGAFFLAKACPLPSYSRKNLHPFKDQTCNQYKTHCICRGHPASNVNKKKSRQVSWLSGHHCLPWPSRIASVASKAANNSLITVAGAALA